MKYCDLNPFFNLPQCNQKAPNFHVVWYFFLCCFAKKNKTGIITKNLVYFRRQSWVPMGSALLKQFIGHAGHSTRVNSVEKLLKCLFQDKHFIVYESRPNPVFKLKLAVCAFQLTVSK